MNNRRAALWVRVAGWVLWQAERWPGALCQRLPLVVQQEHAYWHELGMLRRYAHLWPDYAADRRAELMRLRAGAPQERT